MLYSKSLVFERGDVLYRVVNIMSIYIKRNLKLRLLLIDTETFFCRVYKEVYKMFKDRKLKFAIRKKKGGGGAASFIIGAVLLGSSMVFVPGFVSANSPSSSDSVVRTVRSVSEEIGRASCRERV